MNQTTRIERLEAQAAALDITPAELQAVFALKLALAPFNVTLIEACEQLQQELQDEPKQITTNQA